MKRFFTVSSEDVIRIHDFVIGPKELQGLAKDKSLSAVLERVNNRIQYGFIKDEFHLAASYAAFLSKGHCFNDANKRTSAALVYFVLTVHEIEIDFADLSLGAWVIELASSTKSELDFAQWLREQAKRVGL